jgi:hypothetical protein
LGRKVPSNINQGIRGDLGVIRCIPELDPYRTFRKDELVGPMEALPCPALQIPSHKIFGYLKSNYHQISTLCQELNIIKKNTSIYVKQSAENIYKLLNSNNITILDKPISFLNELPMYSIVMSHGTLNTCQAALAAGIPQIVLPDTIESSLTANIVNQLGVGKQLFELKPQSLKRVISSLIDNPSVKQRSLRVADEIQRKYKETIFETTLSKVETLLM